MIRQKLVLAVAAGVVSFGGGAALAATHGASHPVKKPPVRAHAACSRTCTTPATTAAAKITAAKL